MPASDISASRGPGPAAVGRTGRRPGNPDTRNQILEVAFRTFLAEGYDKTSVRGIAREARVDQALIHRYFGTKHELFLAASRIGFDPTKMVSQVVSGGTEGVGRRIVLTATTVWGSPWGETLLAGIRANPMLLPTMAEFMSGTIVKAAQELLGASRREAELRAAVVESIMIGLGQARYVVRLEPVASMTPEELARIYGPLLQHGITGDLGVRG